jgi:hypothetical protein
MLDILSSKRSVLGSVLEWWGELIASAALNFLHESPGD